MTRGRLTTILPVVAIIMALAAALNQLGRAGRTTASQPRLAVTLRPMLSPDGGVGAIDVTLDIEGASGEAGKPYALHVPIEFAGISHVADRIEGLEARSGDAVVRLSQADDPPDAGGSLYWRRWEIASPVPAHITAHYRARLDPPSPRPGPPFDLRSNGGGVSGAGYSFLVLPDVKQAFDIHLGWDLGAMRSGARAAASVGEGNAQFVGTADRLQESFYMAGPIGRYPDPVTPTGFRAAWLGTPPFDSRSEMEWSAKAYQALQRFFGDTSTAPFYFFMRAGPDNHGYGGAALANSFLLYAPAAGAAPSDDPPSLTIAHEITHHFAGGLDSPEGIEGSWFAEGLAEYYSRLVTFRAGLISPDKFAKAVNATAQGYYANPQRRLPNDKIAAGFWRDKNVQVLPYERAFFYFVDVNQKLLAASHGSVSLDTVVLSLLARQKRGEELTSGVWRKAIEKELGAPGVQEFDSVIIHGDVVVPTSDAFGPCFQRTPLRMGGYELGFDQNKTLDTRPPVVRGVVTGSAAAKAGLRDGDTVLAVEPMEVQRLRGDVTMRIRLTIKRSAGPQTIDYLPRSGAVEGYEWVRRPGVADDTCARRP